MKSNEMKPGVYYSPFFDEIKIAEKSEYSGKWYIRYDKFVYDHESTEEFEKAFCESNVYIGEY